jgi:integrase
VKVEDEWRSAVNRFGSGKIVERLTRADIEAFKDAEADRGLAKATIKKYLGAIKTILDYGVEKGWREHNPAFGVKVREAKNAPQQRLPYTKEHLETIFAGPVYTADKRPSGGAGEAAYWLPILALYTGARLRELGQLRGEDVQSEGKVWYLDINDMGEGQSVKNAGSRRKVPLHPDVREKFLAFVGEKKGPLFPDLKPDIKGNITGNWSKWWGRYQRKKLGIKDSRFVFHSFRHTFKNRSREAGIGKDIHDQMTGHSAKDAGDAYGGALTTEKLAEYVALIRFDIDVFRQGTVGAKP